MSNLLNVSLDFITGEGGAAENSQAYHIDIMQEGKESAKPYDLTGLWPSVLACMQPLKRYSKR